MKLKKQNIIFLLIILTGVILAIIPYTWSDFWPTSPDTTGQVCGINYYLENGEFYPSGQAIAFANYCWSEQTYLPNTLINLGLIKLTSISPVYAPVIMVFVITALIYLFIFLSAKLFFKNSFWPILFTLIFSITSTALSRSIVLTPHNLYGYLFIILIFYFFIKYINSNKKINIILLLTCLLLLSLFHQLSFAMGLLAALLSFIWIYRKNILVLFITILTSAISLSLAGGLYKNIWDPVKFIKKMSEITVGGPLDFHPIYDHPAALGYAVTFLGILGLILMLKNKNKSKIFLYALFLVSLIGAHSNIFNITLVPDRMLAYAWMPLSFFAAYALFVLLKKSRIIKYPIIILIFIGLTVHYLNFIKNDYNFYSKKTLPSPAIAEAGKWLHENGTTPKTILLSQRKKDNAALLSIYSGYLVNVYPQYQFNTSDIRDLKTKHENWQKIAKTPGFQTLYSILTAPNTKKSKQSVKENNIHYVLTKKETYLDGIFDDSQNLDENIKLVFENNKFKIYEFAL